MTVLSKLKVFQQETSLSNEEYTHTHIYTLVTKSSVIRIGKHSHPFYLGTLSSSLSISTRNNSLDYAFGLQANFKS